ncbi:MAG: regulator of sigma E protease [Parasphingorhabdus sp.]|jgi:regulator of sigma E protease
MMDFLMSILGFVLAVGILVTVHEFGHFWVARVLGVKVLKFSIGFGRSLYSWRGKRDDTEYVIAAIPLGGFVKMLDEGDCEVAESERAQAFNRQSLLTRSAVVVAGPAFNFLFAILAYWIVFGIGVDGIKPVVGSVAEGSFAERAGFRPGDQIIDIDGRLSQTWSEHRLYTLDRLLDGEPVTYQINSLDGENKFLELALGEDRNSALSPAGLERVIGFGPDLPRLEAVMGTIAEDSPAEKSGLQPGDRIVVIDDTTITDWFDLVTYVTQRPEQDLVVSIDRAGEIHNLSMQPQAVEVNGQRIGRIGVTPAEMIPDEKYFSQVRLSVLGQFTRAVESTWLMSTLTLKMLYRMIRLEVSPKNISGPITIAKYAGQSVQVGLVPFLLFLSVISVSLGVLNLLPIPVLDGGHLLYYLIELVQGGPVSERVMYWGQQIGIVMIGCLMALAFYNDIVRLFQ